MKTLKLILSHKRKSIVNGADDNSCCKINTTTLRVCKLVGEGGPYVQNNNMGKCLQKHQGLYACPFITQMGPLVLMYCYKTAHSAVALAACTSANDCPVNFN